MVECADLTLLAADAFAYEQPRRDPPSSIRRPGSAIFVQYGPAPDLAPLRTSSLGLESQLLSQNPAARRCSLREPGKCVSTYPCQFGLSVPWTASFVGD